MNKIIWILFVFTTFIVFTFFSSKEFSFILTLAQQFQCFGFGYVYFTIRSTKSTSGLSQNTFICCAIALFSRLLSILIYEGYLPSDASGDYVYKFWEILSFIFCILTILRLKNEEEAIKWYYIAPPMLLLSALIHPGLNNHFIFDIAWTFALYMESFAIFPQIHLFTKQQSVIEDHTSSFVVTQSLTKIICVIFWYSSYEELNSGIDKYSISLYPDLSGYFVMAAQIISILITADFVYKYMQCWRKGQPFIILPY
ncbi:hypothetical protein pb186bvf_009132 [Paramecium bursaria]